MALTDQSDVSAVTILKSDGAPKKVGTPTSVTVTGVDSSGNITRCSGATVPTDGDSGFAQGCIFTYTSGGIGTTLYINEGSATSADFNAVTSGATGGVSTWDDLYTNDKVLNINSTTLTFALTHATNDGLTLTGDASSAGDVVQITNAGSGKDINGTSSTWSISKAGAVLLTSIAGSATDTAITIDANGSGAVTIGATSTGNIELQRNVTMPASRTVTMTGVGGSNVLTITAGDVVLSDGSLTITDADNAATFALTNNTITSSDLFTITSTSLTTGNGILFTANGVTSGNMLSLVTTAAGFSTGNYILVNDGTERFAVKADGAVVITQGVAASVALTATGIQTSAAMVSLTNTGVFTGTGLVTVVANSATTGTIVSITANGLTTGIGQLITSSGTMTTTGSLLTLTGNSATTAAGLFRVNANGLTSGIAAVITSSATAITGAGRLLRVDHTGATGTSATLSEFASAANDETTILKVTASAALAAGKAVVISGAAVTTGILLDISDNTAQTTGTAVNIITNSADTGTRTLLNVKQDHASATGTTVLALTQDAPTSTNFFKVMTMNGVTLWAGNGNTPNTALTGTAGDILFGGDSGKAYYCTGTTSWTALA